jgi:hypothetical protein
MSGIGATTRTIVESTGETYTPTSQAQYKSPGNITGNAPVQRAFLLGSDTEVVSATITSLANGGHQLLTFPRTLLASLINPNVQYPTAINKQTSTPKYGGGPALQTSTNVQPSVYCTVSNIVAPSGLICGYPNLLTSVTETISNNTYTGPVLQTGGVYSTFFVTPSMTIYNASGATLTNQTVTLTINTILIGTQINTQVTAQS